MKITDFDIFRDLLREKSGLVLTPDKSYLLESRLNPVVKKWGFPSSEAMAAALRGVAQDDNLVIDIIEAMTTNETSFFRDFIPFDQLRESVLPALRKARAARKKLRIWSAASSTGQEPYSIAMALKDGEQAALARWRTEILATDISYEVLEQARKGIYSQVEVQRGLSVRMLIKHFTNSGEKWALKDDIRGMVSFEHFNLIDDMTDLGKFDIMFCRNVLLYFDEATKKDVLDRMTAQLEPDGFLFLGTAENVQGITESIIPLPGKSGIYVHRNSAHC